MEIQKNNRKWLICLGAFIAITLFAFLICKFKTIDNDASAADLSQFKAGNIISDAVMSDYASMNEADIQNFLTSKNPCNNTNYAYYLQLSANKNYTWHWANGHFVCLSEERFGDGEVIGSGDTAAHIIWQAAQDYRINPKVLIVLLQKETGLITDKIPNNGDYRKATGYGCPDTAACSSKYYGFKNQVRNAAALFRDVLDGGWSKYAAYKTTYIQYSPDSNCGGSNVYVENRATSALYRYTPYQPNAGALAAGYGEAYCGAYGNRNFYNYYTDWFGDTHYSGPEGEATTLADGIYMITSKSAGMNKDLDIAGDTYAYGTNVSLWNNHGGNNQQWAVTGAGDGYYYFTNPSSGLRLDLNGAVAQNGANVAIWGANDSCAQKWKPISTPDSYITLVSACSESYAIDLVAGDTSNGTNIQVWRANNGDNQKWHLKPIATIPSGTYRLTSAINTSRSLDVAGLGTRNGNTIQVWDNNDMGAQEWTVIYDAGSGYYHLTNPHSGRRLDLLGVSSQNGTKINIWDANNSCAQNWGIVSYGNNTYTLISACNSARAVDLNGNGDNGNLVTIWQTHNGANQRWVFEPIQTVNDGVYNIVSVADGNHTVDLYGDTNSNGMTVGIWNFHGAANQQWQISNAGNGLYYIQHPYSNQRLDVYTAATYNGQRIDTWEANDSCAQKWRIAKASNNTYAFLSSCETSRALDIPGANISNGVGLQVWDTHLGSNQQWYLNSL